LPYGHQGRPHADSRGDGIFQNQANLGFCAAAMLGGTQFQGAVSGLGQVSDSDSRHGKFSLLRVSMIAKYEFAINQDMV
jgi:hypothetical protein